MNFAALRVALLMGAVVGTLGGRALRGKMAAAFGNDHPAAVVKDALAVAVMMVMR